MYNYNKLLGKMKERNVTQEDLATALKISSASLNRRLKNHAEFRQSEMKDALRFLNVELSAIEEYFFAH